MVKALPRRLTLSPNGLLVVVSGPIRSGESSLKPDDADMFRMLLMVATSGGWVCYRAGVDVGVNSDV